MPEPTHFRSNPQLELYTLDDLRVEAASYLPMMLKHHLSNIASSFLGWPVVERNDNFALLRAYQAHKLCWNEALREKFWVTGAPMLPRERNSSQYESTELGFFLEELNFSLPEIVERLPHGHEGVVQLVTAYRALQELNQEELRLPVTLGPVFLNLLDSITTQVAQAQGRA